MFPAFVINLDRDVERAAAFARHAEACSLSVERLAGFDAETHVGPFPEGTLNSALYTRGSIGCALSHRALWQRCAASSPIIVFEDDAHIRRDFTAVVPEVVSKINGSWDIILFGYNTDSVLNVRVDDAIDARVGFGDPYPTPGQMAAFAASRDPVIPLRLRTAFGACGYAISPAGARKLLESCFPLDNRLIVIRGIQNLVRASTIDGMMNWAYPTIAAYACFPPLVLSPNTQATSHTASRPGTTKAGRRK